MLLLVSGTLEDRIIRMSLLEVFYPDSDHGYLPIVSIVVPFFGFKPRPPHAAWTRRRPWESILGNLL